ncbi:mitochondrial carrier [Guyanagaster necrorhizus]|uniref:Mitochondrial carrier n=1 Tax=Guyanagaster necrorhizus TaxID=856835 RepID=A0A9P7VJJ2_9AGAR|nr:mitochondrial carrier [Guyanagaster necrorhizus MCA 3950]KAG7441510.1 mitochondrial carrier [Guyanagaster necrorhizus MCA 3950]
MSRGARIFLTFLEIVMMRLQGDFTKPPEKRFNYKNCIDALFRGKLLMVREEGVSALGREVGPNVFRSVLMNAIFKHVIRYDFFKAELLKTPYSTTTFFAISRRALLLFVDPYLGTVATTVCSPADVLKSRIMNASGPGSNSTLGVIKASLKNEGPMFMFKGWLPAWTRLQPTTILIFLILEQLKNGVDFSRSKGYTFL